MVKIFVYLITMITHRYTKFAGTKNMELRKMRSVLNASPAIRVPFFQNEMR
jgi:hypothetical protein